MSFYLFPYENVTKGAKVIIYGAGNVGRCFMEQIKNTGYCNIIAIADRNCNAETILGSKYIAPMNINKEKYDFVVIAVNNVDVADEISRELVSKYDINRNHIIFGCQREYNKKNVDDYICGAHNSTILYLGVYMGPGLGDIIFYKRFIVELISKISCEFYVDIYATSFGYEFVKSIYSDLKNTNIISGNLSYFRARKYKYDVAFTMCMLLYFEGMDSHSLYKKDKKFAEIIKKLVKKIDYSDLDMARYSDQYIHYERAKRLGLNCYTSFNYGDIFNINDYHVNIPMTKNAFYQFRKLNFTRYITLTYGWCKDVVLKGKTIDKVWPLEYYQELVFLLKQRYPQYRLIQVGAKDNKKIIGVDDYALGYDLEISKYILKNAILHIDCEGGLVHLATQLGTKCAVMFGPTHVSYYGYKENINISVGGCCECRHLVRGHECMRKLDKPECMYNILPEITFESIKKYLDREYEEDVKNET